MRPSATVLCIVAILCASSLSAQNSTTLDTTDVRRWREDLAFLRKEMPAHHPNLFHEMTPAQFDSALNSISSRLPTLARHQVIVELQKLDAMVGDGHSNVGPWRDSVIAFHTLPIALYSFDEGIIVRAADSAHSSLLGAKVVAINGVPVDSAAARIRPLISRDNEMGVRAFTPFFLMMPEILQATGIVPDMRRIAVTVDQDGKRRTVALSPAGLFPMLTGDADRSWIKPAAWVDARDKAPTPLWLSNSSNMYWFTYLPASRTLYTQINTIQQKSTDSLSAFMARAITTADSAGAERFVLDLRLNGGGNGYFNNQIMLPLIKSKYDTPGHLYVLTGRRTWSAAQMLVTDLMKYTTSIFVGEPTASHGNHFGDSYRIVMPNSRVTVRVSTLWHQYLDSRDKRVMIEPQIKAPLTFADYRAGRDPALAAVTSESAINRGPSSGDVKAAIDSYIEPYVVSNNFSGQILIRRGGETVYERSIGNGDRDRKLGSDVDRRLGITPTTRFHVASLSMHLTAAAVLRLVDQGKLSLDTRVSDVVPSVRGGDRITIRNLLEQRSGLSDINARADYDEILQHRQTPASLVAMIANDTLLFPAGSKYMHEEHSAFNLLALIIERRTGLDFPHAMQSLLFTPAGMTRSAVDDDAGSCAGDAARGYAPEGVAGIVPARHIYWSAKAGNASACTTARDEARFVAALFKGGLLTAASRALVSDTTGPPVGYGWFRRQNARFGQFAYYLSGRAPGFASYVIYLPREDLTVVALSNIYSSSTTTIGSDIAAIALGLPYTPLALRTPLLRADSLGIAGARFRFPGDFYQPNATLAFEAFGPEMFLKWPSGDLSPLIPLDRDHLIDRAYWEPVTVTRDASGTPISITYDRFTGARVSTR